MQLYLLWQKVGWAVIVALTAFPILRWVMMTPLSFRFSSGVVALLSIGQITGMIGIVLYAINLILTTRFPIIEDLFGGLNKVYMAHHLVGGLALLMLLVHPIALSLHLVTSSVRAAALLLVPRLSNLPVAYGIIAMIGLVGLLIVTYYTKLPYRFWLLSHKFLGLFFAIGVLHVYLVPSGINSDKLLRWYILGISFVGIASYIYRTLLPHFFTRRFKYIVTNASVVGPGTVTLQMTPVRRRLDFKPGQFLFVSFKDDGISPEWHPFSISSATSDSSLGITVKGLGKYTGTLVKALPLLKGLRVMVEGAYGRFSFRNFRNPRQIWIAGGIGITPFLSMAQSLAGENYDIDLYYSVKDVSEFVDFDQLSQKVRIDSGGKFRVIPYIAGKEGLLTARKIMEHSGDLTGREILICGPPPMMRALRQQFLAMRIPNNRIHSEEFAMQ